MNLDDDTRAALNGVFVFGLAVGAILGLLVAVVAVVIVA